MGLTRTIQLLEVAHSPLLLFSRKKAQKTVYQVLFFNVQNTTKTPLVVCVVYLVLVLLVLVQMEQLYLFFANLYFKVAVNVERAL